MVYNLRYWEECSDSHFLFPYVAHIQHIRYGFGAYFSILPGSEWSALMLTYGFPLALIGFALKVKVFSRPMGFS